MASLDTAAVAALLREYGQRSAVRGGNPYRAKAYSAPPTVIVGYSYGFFAARDLVRMGACLTVAAFVVLVFLVPFYWPLIGLQ
jgi:hypothetical protein